MSRVVTSYKGIKYSLQPHGLRSRLLIAFFVFVVAFGGALLNATAAQADPTPGTCFVAVVVTPTPADGASPSTTPSPVDCPATPPPVTVTVTDTVTATVTVTKTVFSTKTVYAAPVAAGKTCAQIGHRVHRGDPDYTTKLDTDGDGIGCEAYPESVIIKAPVVTPTPTASATPQPSHTPPPLLDEQPVENETASHSSLWGWGIAVAAIGGGILTVMGVAGLTRRRRYQGAHHVDPTATQVIPAVKGDDGYSISDYNPSGGGYDPALGGSAGSTYQGGQDTAEMPPVKD